MNRDDLIGRFFSPPPRLCSRLCVCYDVREGLLRFFGEFYIWRILLCVFEKFKGFIINSIKIFVWFITMY